MAYTLTQPDAAASTTGRKPRTIKAEITPHQIILSGGTYPLRNDIRIHGFSYSKGDETWRAPYTQQNEAYARSIAHEVVKNYAAPSDAPAPPWSISQALQAQAAIPPHTDDDDDDATTSDSVVTVQIQDIDHAPRRRIKRTTEPTQQAPANAADPAAASDLMDALRGFVLANAAASKAGDIDPEKVQALITRELEAVYGKLDVVTATVKALMDKLNDRPATRVDVIAQDTTRTIDGLSHKSLPDLIKCLAAGLHVWLAGPSGSGKTHGAEQAAQALGLTFRLQGAMTMAHELTGFVDAGGKYHETPFVATFRNGGVILLDELDAGSNEALLALNAALANGVMCLPSGEIIRAHRDFKCVGAANTFGQGATADYVGRTRIDAAFLQRFGARITWAYDEALETAMADMPEWSERVQRARHKAQANGLKVLITPRASIAGAKLIRAGYTPDQAADLTYLADLSPAQRQQVS